MKLEEHFGLSKPPFPKAATKASLLMHPALESTLEKLHFALERDTIALLVAESGCGKSTALSLFAQSLDAATYNVLSISLTTLNPFSFIAHFAAATGLPGRRFKGETAAALIMHFRSQPKRTVILVDEAHLLPDSSLEDLRLLSADNLDRNSPFALVLVGQPILRDRIACALLPKMKSGSFWNVTSNLQAPRKKSFLPMHWLKSSITAAESHAWSRTSPSKPCSPP
jgi:general secretion pathway protein A